MEKLPSFVLDMQREDHPVSWDFKSGFWHFFLHPLMRNFFL